MKNVCFQMSRRAWLAIAMAMLLAFPALAQKITVQGTVTEPDGEPAIGVSITVEGTTIGVNTDYNGDFRLECDPNATLVVSYVGYETMHVKVDGRTHLDIKLASQSKALEEVVVIGYGTVKKEDATGSVSVIKPDEIEAGISTSAQDLLTGASPGVVVTASGGSPDGAGTIRIRGGSSLSATNDPLIVLDGVPLTNDGFDGMNPLAMIAPDNIESMTILKDASATAIYGSRASNGVIIITTKKGQKGKPQINFSATVSVNTARKKLDVLDGNTFADMIKTYYGEESSAYAAIGRNSDGSVINTNWQDEILRTSVSQDYNLSVGGTAGWLPYRVSGSYTQSEGIIKTSDMKRVTAGINLTPQFFNGLLKVQLNVKGIYIRQQDADDSAIGDAVAIDPTRTVHDYTASGNSQYPYFYNGWSTSVTGGQDFNTQGTLNPVSRLVDPDKHKDVYRSNGNLQIDYALHFLPDLHLNLNLGYDVEKGSYHYGVPANSPLAWNSNYKDGAGYEYYKYELRRNTLLDFYANYKKNFDKIESDLDVMVGYSWQRFDDHGRQNNNEFTTMGFQMPSATNGVLTQLTSSDSYKVGDTYSPWYYWNTGRLQLLSFFGRLNYTYKDTYLLTFTLRDDGTSRFSKDNRWALFPSLALGWKINNMPFMESVNQYMNEFKLRLGWGITGQQSVGGYFPYVATYSVSQQGSYYPNMYTGQYVNSSGQVVGLTYYPEGYNPDLKWEQTTTWNVGLDMAWWNNRLTVALDWYLRNSKDLLSYVTVAPGSATTNMMDQNIGTLRNIGLEATIGARVISTKDFMWKTSYNIAWNHNEITKLNNTDDPNSYVTTGSMGATGNTCQAHKAGYAAYTFLLYEQVYDSNGDPIEGCYVDQNGDGQINQVDLVFKHSRDPKVTMTWNNNFSYKNWDFSFSLRANIGNYVYNNVKAGRIYTAGMYTNSTLRNLVKNDVYFSGQEFYSDYFLENAGFLRCDNITVGYTWDNLIKNQLRLRLYGAVQNPFVITKYSGIDPEIFDGIDSSVYPRPVTFNIGVVATF